MLFGAFLGPIFTVLLFNCVIFVIVIKVLIKHSRKKFGIKKDKKMVETVKRLTTHQYIRNHGSFWTDMGVWCTHRLRCLTRFPIHLCHFQLLARFLHLRILLRTGKRSTRAVASIPVSWSQDSLDYIRATLSASQGKCTFHFQYTY